jgi:hypothetical protein
MVVKVSGGGASHAEATWPELQPKHPTSWANRVTNLPFEPRSLCELAQAPLSILTDVR